MLSQNLSSNCLTRMRPSRSPSRMAGVMLEVELEQHYQHERRGRGPPAQGMSWESSIGMISSPRQIRLLSPRVTELFASGTAGYQSLPK